MSSSSDQVKSLPLRAPPPSPVCTTIQQQHELSLQPPPQPHSHPHKVPPKPCAVPTPPQLAQRESLAEVQPLINQAGCSTLPSRAAAHQYSQNAQVHQQHNHPDVTL